MKKPVLLSILLILLIFGCSDSKRESLSQLEDEKKHYQNNSYDSSITFLNNAIKLNPSNSEAYYYLSKVNYDIENYSEGLKFVNLAEKHEFNTDSINSLKLKTLFALEKYDDYIQFNNELISKNSSNYKLYFNKAKALYNKSAKFKNVAQLKLALENINISFNLNKKDNEIYVLRGAIRYALSDNKGAIDDFEIAINQEKKDSLIISYAYRFKGLTNIQLKNFNHAEVLLDSAIIYNNDSAVLYHNRGNARFALNKADLACKDYRKALELGYNDAIYNIRENCK